MSSQSENQGFSKGAIVKIRLKDFMTYSEVEFNPGPNLNLILGPNGTGKSTIVSAICLGMNGKPSTLGRASTLAGYVRHGASKAIITIDLHNPDGPNFSVTREITLDNKSTWKYQGKTVTHSQIEEIIRKLHIQVDNLCQFLPQEQVQNFSRLKDKQLLVGTMKAVGNPELEQKFDELIKMQAALGSESVNQEKDELELKKLQEENKRWESDVKSFKDREALKENVRILEKKKAWITYKEEVRKFKELQELANQLKEKYEKVTARFKPLEKQISEKESVAVKTQNALKLKRDKFNQEITAINQNIFSVDQFKQKMENLASELSSKRASERKRLENIRSLQQQILGLEKDLETFDLQSANADSQLKEVNRQLKELHPTFAEVEHKKQQVVEDGRQIKHEINECQSKIKTIEDVDKNRLLMLQRENEKIREAILWLRANKDKFRAPIHEPPIISLSVKNREMAKYVEGSIGWNDLVAFYCEDKQDMNELMRILRDEKRLGVNVVHSPPSHEPSTSEYQPRMTISELRNYGFHSFVRDLFVGPEPVVRYLCKMYRVHNIPVGDSRAFENFGVIRDQYGSLFPVFYGGDKHITIRTSKYRRDAITQMSDVRPSRFLGQAVDVQALQQLQARLSELENQLASTKPVYDSIMQEELELKRTRENLLQQRNNVHKIMADRRVAQSRLDTKRNQLKGIENEAIDLVAEERNVKQKCGVSVKSMCKKLQEHTKRIEQLITEDRERDALQIFMEVLRVTIQSLQNELTREKEQIHSLKDEKDRAERAAQESKRRAKQAQEVVQRLLNITQRSELSDEVRAQFDTLPDTVDEIEDAISNANARIQLMGRADEQIVRDYEMREYRIQELLKKINSLNSRASSMKGKMDQLKGEFLPPLRDLISRINNSFGRYYASMKCAGEVCLYTGEGNIDDDFKNYGIKIRVKYRSSEPLIDLSATHHSGGERAVATALYMLAMQELTQVPFRCVDEINQGMDPINERRVFDLLVQTACRDTSAQYFLLTPKLLPGLNYSPNMKIHFVQNGEHVCNEWKIDKHLQAIRALNHN